MIIPHTPDCGCCCSNGWIKRGHMRVNADIVWLEMFKVILSHLHYFIQISKLIALFDSKFLTSPLVFAMLFCSNVHSSFSKSKMMSLNILLSFQNCHASVLFSASNVSFIQILNTFPSLSHETDFNVMCFDRRLQSCQTRPDNGQSSTNRWGIIFWHILGQEPDQKTIHLMENMFEVTPIKSDLK